MLDPSQPCLPWSSCWLEVYCYGWSPPWRCCCFAVVFVIETLFLTDSVVNKGSTFTSSVPCWLAESEPAMSPCLRDGCSCLCSVHLSCKVAVPYCFESAGTWYSSLVLHTVTCRFAAFMAFPWPLHQHGVELAFLWP